MHSQCFPSNARLTTEALKNPLTAAKDADDRFRLLGLFPHLASYPSAPCLALRPYLLNCPERFFDRRVHALVFDWLQHRDATDRKGLQQYFVDSGTEVSAAMLFLRQINSEAWHDRPLEKSDDFQTVGLIDRVLHPTYLRLVEGVFGTLLRPMAHFSRLDRGKQADGLDVFNVVEELKNTPLAPCVSAYRHTVRNGIGHGGITYLQSEIRYRDKKGNSETLDVRSVVRLCDDMVDSCNAIASAVKLFLLTVSSFGYRTPHELLVEELMEESRSPWWTIDGCLESELSSGRQLLVYARPESRDVLKVHWASVQSAALAESLAPGFDRYFLSLRTSKGWPGWAAFDGGRLRQARESGGTRAPDFAMALEQNGFFYRPMPSMPRVFGMLDTVVQSFRLHWQIGRRQLSQTLGRATIAARDAKMHRNSWGCVVTGAVVVEGLDSANAATVIQSNRQRIVRAAMRAARAEQPLFSLARYLPLGYARVAIFNRDFRRRRLGSFGLGPQLVCTVQLQRNRRIKSPDIMASTVEISGKWRIAWNRAWIDSGGYADI